MTTRTRRKSALPKDHRCPHTRVISAASVSTMSYTRIVRPATDQWGMSARVVTEIQNTNRMQTAIVEMNKERVKEGILDNARAWLGG